VASAARFPTLKGVENILMSKVDKALNKLPCASPPFVPSPALPDAQFQSLRKLFVSSAALAMNAYCPQTETVPTCQATPACIKAGGLVETYAVNDNTFTAYGYGGITTDKSTIVVSFRGTKSAQDWLRDASASQGDIAFQGAFNWLKGRGIKVHAAWLHAYILAFRSSGGLIAPTVAMVQKYPKATLLVIGHSMAAAYAQLFGLDIQHTLAESKIKVPTKIVTFGGVRTGNDAFAKFVDSEFPEGTFYRVVNYNDFAPHMPPANFGYQHAGQEVWVNGAYKPKNELAQTDIRICARGVEDPTCSLSTNGGCSGAAHVTYMQSVNGKNCLSKQSLVEISTAGIKAALAARVDQAKTDAKQAVSDAKKSVSNLAHNLMHWRP